MWWALGAGRGWAVVLVWRVAETVVPVGEGRGSLIMSPPRRGTPAPVLVSLLGGQGGLWLWWPRSALLGDGLVSKLVDLSSHEHLVTVKALLWSVYERKDFWALLWFYPKSVGMIVS